MKYLNVYCIMPSLMCHNIDSQYFPIPCHVCCNVLYRLRLLLSPVSGVGDFASHGFSFGRIWKIKIDK